MRWCTSCATPSPTASSRPASARRSASRAPGPSASPPQQRGGMVALTCADDGRGVSAEVQARVPAGGSLADLLAEAGFSTAGGVSALAGRGVGLDAVKRHIEGLGGVLEVESDAGVGDHGDAAGPADAGDRDRAAGRARPPGLRRAAGGRGARGARRPRAPAPRAAIRRARRGHGAARRPRRLARHGRSRAARRRSGRDRRSADPAGPPWSATACSATARWSSRAWARCSRPSPDTSGAAILDDGAIALLLDPAHLVRTARATPRVPRTADDGATRPAPKILVVDDQFTVRELERTILEAAGYRVRTAEDGRAALAVLDARARRRLRGQRHRDAGDGRPRPAGGDPRPPRALGPAGGHRHLPGRRRGPRARGGRRRGRLGRQVAVRAAGAAGDRRAGWSARDERRTGSRGGLRRLARVRRRPAALPGDGSPAAGRGDHHLRRGAARGAGGAAPGPAHHGPGPPRHRRGGGDPADHDHDAHADRRDQRAHRRQRRWAGPGRARRRSAGSAGQGRRPPRSATEPTGGRAAPTAGAVRPRRGPARLALERPRRASACATLPRPPRSARPGARG